MLIFTLINGLYLGVSIFNEYRCLHYNLRGAPFDELSSTPGTITSKQLQIIEKFIVFFYYGKTRKQLDINCHRMNDFEHSAHGNLRLLPPCRAALTEQIKRATYKGGWVASLCKRDVELPDPQLYGRIVVDGKYLPKWQEGEPVSVDFVT